MALRRHYCTAQVLDSHQPQEGTRDVRQAAEVFGWIWIGINVLAALYSLLVNSFGYKGFVEAFTTLLIASPGIFLVNWGRRREKSV